MISLTNEPIETVPRYWLKSRRTRPVRSCCSWARRANSPRAAGRQSLDYECYPEMAEKKLAELEAERRRRRWPIIGCQIVHRLGHLELGEASIAIAVSSAHRADAFAAGQWLIDTIEVGADLEARIGPMGRPSGCIPDE